MRAMKVSFFHHRRRLVGSAIVLGIVVLSATLAGWRPLALARRFIVWAVESPILEERSATERDLTPFTHLAASQVGYGPNAAKAFTSPQPFASFAIVDEEDQSIVWRGVGPGHHVATDLLGSLRNVWVGDFTNFATSGRYRIAADNGLTSHPFAIGTHVFDPAVRAVQRSFYFQRAFTEIPGAHAEGPWTHDSDAHAAPPGERRGWHDAGDFSLYNMTAASSLFWLFEAYSDFAPDSDDTNIPESGNGVPDLLDEARWELEWLLSVESGTGGFRNTTCLTQYRAYGDNALERTGRYVSGEVGTVATARTVGILAYASIIYAAFDPVFAQRLRDAAWRGWRYLEVRPSEQSDGPTCPAFRQDDDLQSGRAVRMFAAAGMLLATGDRRFNEAFETYFDDIDGDPSAYRFNVYASLVYLRAATGDPVRQVAIRSRLRQHADRALDDARAHPFEWAGRYFWGSIGAGFERSGAFNAKLCLGDPIQEAAHCDQVLANLHYMFGRNYYQFAYVSGIPGVTQGRRRAFHHWLATLNATPYLFPGLVAGGPSETPRPDDASRPRARPRPVWGYWGDPAMPRDAATPIDGRYTDNDSWSTNEIDIGWQAVTLYNLYVGQWLSRRDQIANTSLPR